MKIITHCKVKLCSLLFISLLSFHKSIYSNNTAALKEKIESKKHIEVANDLNKFHKRKQIEKSNDVFLDTNDSFSVKSNKIDAKANLINSQDITGITRNATDEIQKIKISFKEFILSFSLNFFSEIGDKSFLCIILVYNQLPPYVLFIVASLTEILMNAFSVFIGYKLRYWSTIKILCHFIGMLASFLFSFLLIYEQFIEGKLGKENSTSKSEKEIILNNDQERRVNEPNSDSNKNKVNLIIKVLNISWIIFVSELGDKSQITTIILSTEYNPISIFLGTALAHVLGILLSMTIGFCLSKSINKSVLVIIGAMCFIYFGVQLAINFYLEGGFKTLIS